MPGVIVTGCIGLAGALGALARYVLGRFVAGRAVDELPARECMAAVEAERETESACECVAHAFLQLIAAGRTLEVPVAMPALQKVPDGSLDVVRLFAQLREKVVPIS